MVKIEQSYSEFMMKYNELKLVTDTVYEQGKKEINENNFESVGTAFFNKKNELNLLNETDKELLEEKLIKIDLRLCMQGKRILVYIKKRIERIVVNKEIDFRSYCFVRVVIRGSQPTPVIEEAYPENITLSFVVNFIDSVVKNNIFKELTSSSHKMNLENTRITLLPQAAGFFIHEAIGHLLEADIYDFFKNSLNTIKFPMNFSLMDNPTGYENLIGMNRYDDFGNLIKPIVLVKNGEIQNIISLDNGFARSEKFDHKPLPRMRMLILENTQGNPSRKNCTLFISRIHSGQVTPANFTYRLKGNGYLIDNHDVHKEIYNIEIQGDLKESIESIDYIGISQETFSADCMKHGQIIRVGAKAPSISFICKNIEGDVFEADDY